MKTDKCKCRKVQLWNDDQCMFGLWADTIIFYCIKIKYVVCQCSTPTYSMEYNATGETSGLIMKV